MKTLQNNFTTPEQSKRLLELGVPKWTADCFYGGFPIGIRVNPSSFFIPSDPCWSVGRLIEIVLKTPGFPYLCSEPTISLTNHNINRIIDLIIETIEVNLDVVDFSKLEE